MAKISKKAASVSPAAFLGKVRVKDLQAARKLLTVFLLFAGKKLITPDRLRLHNHHLKSGNKPPIDAKQIVKAEKIDKSALKNDIEKKDKINTATQKQLTLLANDIQTGKIKTIKDVETIANQNREAFEMNQVDIDYILSEAQKILPEKYDPATKIEKFFGKQKYPQKQKYGHTYEQREDGKWHRLD